MTSCFKHYCTGVFFGLMGLAASAQIEYLVTINPQNGSFVKIDSLPGIHWIVTSPGYTTFDDLHQRYIFRGMDDGWNEFLVTVDGATGAVLYQPSFPVLSDSADNVTELQYDDAAGILYGLRWDHSEQREYFGTVDQVTGIFTDIDSIPEVMYVVVSPCFTTFDHNHHRYIFSGITDAGVSRLYTIDAPTGQVISNPAFPPPPNDIVELQYDNGSDTLYGIHPDYNLNKFYLASYDQTNCTYVSIDSIPGLENLIASPHFTTFDEVNHRYIFYGLDHSWAYRLYTLDASNASIVYQPLFPPVTPPENVIELQYDNGSDTLFALHWAQKIITTSPSLSGNAYFSIAPNPFSESTVLALSQNYREVTLWIYDAFGHMIKRIDASNVSSVIIDKGDLPAGIYFISVNGDHKNFGTAKVVVE